MPKCSRKLAVIRKTPRMSRARQQEIDLATRHFKRLYASMSGATEQVIGRKIKFPGLRPWMLENYRLMEAARRSEMITENDLRIVINARAY